MISIRKNTFETNSSSTHAICYSKDTPNHIVERYTPEQLKNINKKFKYWTSESHTKNKGINIYLSLEDRLTWLLTSMKQSGLDNPFVIQLRYDLSQIMPNAIFDLGNEDEYYYEFEDIEIIWWDYFEDFDGSFLLDRDQLIKFLCEGIVVWGSRDIYDWSLNKSVIEEDIHKFDECVMRFSG